MNRRLIVCALVALLLSLCACSPRVEPPKPEDIAARANALIEAGNEAFKQQQFAIAAKRYAAAAVENPEDPAAYYGMGMALAKLGRDDQARVAYAKARELARAAEAAQHP